MIDKLHEYHTISARLSRYSDYSYPVTLSRLLISRFWYGWGPQWYDVVQFQFRPLSEWTEHLGLDERLSLQKLVDSPEHRQRSESKLIFYDEAVENGIPTPRLYAALAFDDSVSSRQVPVVRTGEELANILKGLGDRSIIAKPIDGEHGWGVNLVNLKNDQLYDSKGKAIPWAQVPDWCRDQYRSKLGFMFQEYIRTHEDFRPIMPHTGLGTIRMVTFVTKDKGAILPYAVLKLPRGESIVDNMGDGASNWGAPVDVRTGKLGPAVGITDDIPITHRFTHHPETGVPIEGFQIPLFQDATAMILKAAEQFKELRTMGWDVAIGENGPTIIDPNWDFGHEMIEWAEARGLRTEFKAYIQNCL